MCIRDSGWIAQDVQKLIPNAVSCMPESDYLAVDKAYVVPYLARAIQQEDEKVEGLQTRINQLEKEVQELKVA